MTNGLCFCFVSLFVVVVLGSGIFHYSVPAVPNSIVYSFIIVIS